MLVDLFDVVSNAGKQLIQEVTYEPSEFILNGDTYPINIVRPLALTAKNNNGKSLLIRLEGEMTAISPCDRCLEEVEIPLVLSFEREFPLERERVIIEELDEAEYLDGLTLDTDQLVYDELLVNWPMKVLCKDDCKGICNKCGCNLNKSTCDCDRTVLDPRMAAIQDVFNKFKEV